MLVLIAFITAHLAGSGRIETRIAANLVASAVTEAAADGAVHQAIFNLLDPQPERRWPLDGSTRALTIGDCSVNVQLHDEAARINPNLTSPALLEALLRGTGSDAVTARRIAGAIGEWVGAAARQRGPEALDAAYRAAGLDYGPPGEPLETLAELQRVLGMTPEVFAALSPHLSLFAPAEPAPAHADPVVSTALASVGRVRPGGARPAPRQTDIATARITATAEGPGNARVTRTAIVRVVSRPRRYTILAWYNEPG